MNEANQKAKELVDKFENILPEIEIYNYDESIRQPQRIAPYNKKDTVKAKKCSLIACDELIQQNGELYLSGLDGEYYRNKNAFLFDVKQEITKL